MANRIKELRKAMGMTQQEVAKIIGITQNNFSYWENGKVKIDNQSLAKLAEIFGVTVDYILCRTNNPNPFPNPNELSPNYTPADAISVSLKHYEIPIYGDVKAGLTGYADDSVEGYEQVSADDINIYEIKEYFWLRVIGNSMEPVLNEDDLVLIHKQTSVDSGTLAVVLVDKEEGLIKYVEYGRDWIELISENEAYTPRRFEKQDVLRVYVVGEVIQSKRFYKKCRYKHF